jgi:hypothetical protein
MDVGGGAVAQLILDSTPVFGRGQSPALQGFDHALENVALDAGVVRRQQDVDERLQGAVRRRRFGADGDKERQYKNGRRNDAAHEVSFRETVNGSYYL